MADRLDYPFQVDYGEGVVVSQVARLREGRPLYPASDRTGPGFVGANYPPLYYLVSGLLPGHPASVFWGARLLSLLGYAATALLAGLVAGRVARSWPAGLLAAAVVLALPPAREWGVFAKPDLLAAAGCGGPGRVRIAGRDALAVARADVGLLVQAGLPVEYYDPSLIYKLVDASVWDEATLLSQIEARHFAFIMTEINLETSPERAGRWTPATIAAIRQHYRVLHRDILVVYEPRDD